MQENTDVNFMTVQQFVESVDAVNIGGVRWEIFNRNLNGLSKSGAIFKNGRKWFVRRNRYINWMLERGGVK